MVSLGLNSVPMDPSNTLPPSPATLCQDIFRLVDETDEALARRARKVVVVEAADRWLRRGGPIPDLEDLAECQNLNVVNTTFGLVLQKVQVRYEQLLRDRAEDTKMEAEGWQHVSSDHETLVANSDESMSLV